MSNSMHVNSETQHERPKNSRQAIQFDLELEEFVSRLESEWHERGSAEFVKFLPSTDHQQFDAVAMELMRVDGI